MTDIIHLLPDSVANQIAAGEVVDRPSSVVKELVENSIDAGATDIAVIIKDSGKTLIQVVDNGKGMSETDARMAFERHATSKISSAADLYSLQTMGFRGEALASIAAIAQIDLRTRREGDEMGVLLQIEGSKFVAQEPVACAVGSSFAVKNLFFNTPARRRFLKSDTTEFGHIVTVFNRIALVYPNVSFSLFHNDVEMSNYAASNQAQRIVDVFGKKLKTQLLPVDIETDVVKISGYVCRPESATKTSANQYFFVNGRFMWHPSFNKAVLQAYDRMLPAGTYPGFYIFLQVDPKTLDVNIHPQKIEVKFENEKTIWSIIQASVREALGKFNVVPDIDFEHADPSVEIPVLKPGTEVKKPSTGASSSYNPFADTSVQKRSYRSGAMDWEALYKGFEKQGRSDDATQMKLGIEPELTDDATVKPMAENSEFLQFRGKYIVTTVKSGLMLIDQHRAHQRVLYDKYMNSFSGGAVASQQMMFPEIVELTADLSAVLEKIVPDLQKMGFGIEPFGKNTYRITAQPEGMSSDSPAGVVKDIVSDVAQGGSLDVDAVRRNMALSLSKANAVAYGKQLSQREMNELVSSLFVCSNCNNTPDGKVIIVVLSDSDIDGHF